MKSGHNFVFAINSSETCHDPGHEISLCVHVWFHLQSKLVFFFFFLVSNYVHSEPYPGYLNYPGFVRVKPLSFVSFFLSKIGISENE